MNTKEMFVIYSNKHNAYYQTVTFNMPSWTKSLQECYWCLDKERARSIIDKFNLKDSCDIRECVATYPEGIEPFIELIK